MTIIAILLSLTSGFALMGYREPPANLSATSIIIDLSLAPLTAIIASRRGRSAFRWAIVGVAFGAWALAAVLILPEVRPAPSRPQPPPIPPTSDAA